MKDRLTIRAVEAIPIRVQGTRDFRISEGQTRIHTSTILRLLTEEDGVEGIAEVVCAPPGKPEELPEEVLASLRLAVAPALVGVAAADRNLACERVERALKERPWTKAAVNVALHDLHARMLGVPLTDLLGGRVNDRIPVIGPVVGIQSPEVMASQAAAEVADGFAAVKIKVGESIPIDVARVAAVREAMGAAASLRVDANDHYQPADAIRLIRAIERYDIEHVEQPVARRDILGMQAVRRAIGVPLMTDDMVATPLEAMNVIRLEAADRMKVKVTKHGLDGARAIIDMLAAAGLKAVLGHVFEMGLAAVAEANLAACVSNLAPPHEIGSMKPMGTALDIIAEDLWTEPGFCTIPEGPGLGARLDMAKVESLRVAG